MAYDMNTTASDTTSADQAAITTREAKTRAARRPEAATSAAPSTTASAPVKRRPGRKGGAEKGAGTIAARTKNSAAVKPNATDRLSKRGSRKIAVAATVVDELTELLKLEEENQKLRKALSDKLRTENTDLRKKLGLT